MSGSEKTGTDFWSRRKAAVRQADEAEQAEKQAEAQAEARAELEQKTDEDILQELELPDPDTLGEGDDFSRFLSGAVPERLRRRALRRLWALNPVLANLDGLVEYAEDYTDAATVVPDLQTVYKIGRGMLDQFAADDEADKAEVEITEVTEAEEIQESGSELQCEENTAPHNDFLQKRKTSMQLTQSDELVHSRKQGADSLDLPDSALVDAEEEPRPSRRRMRFDYS
ncbi:DUF3306 domain-containing protein [Roseibium sp. SCPC15]|uniref:DUF3306 domain-containing protein n=1 Tax=Roseibium sp. SCP15 TaxID=3141376 RepID=UPI00333BC7BE